MTGKSGFNLALASTEQTAGPEEAQNGQKVNDPYEHFNRQVFDFNDSLYFHVLKPAARVYSVFLPTDLRVGIKNGFHNLLFPSRFVNFLLQRKGEKAGYELIRFVINSTFGMAGLIDIAQARFLIENQEADFGQTLAIWGVDIRPVSDGAGAWSVKSKRPFRLWSGFRHGPGYLVARALVGELFCSDRKIHKRCFNQNRSIRRIEKSFAGSLYRYARWLYPV